MTKEEKKEVIAMLFGIVFPAILACLITIFAIITKGYVLLIGTGMIFILLIAVIIDNKDVMYFPWRREKYKIKKEP
ncbi:MAG: hypothetical protein AAB361_01140 [Patescibacteria group bacterium]